MEKFVLGAAGVVALAKGANYLLSYHDPPPPGSSVFITGCDTGIGRATAILLHQKGFRVFAGVLSAAAGETLVQEINKDLDRIIPLKVDVTKEEDVQAAAKAIDEIVKEKGLWAIVNNAGIGGHQGPVEYVPLHLVKKTLDVNLFGIYNVLQKMMYLVRRGKGGRIVNVSSMNGFITWRFHSAYCISKFGVVALSDALRQELFDMNIAVSVIQPGGTATNIFNEGIAEIKRTLAVMDKKYEEVYGAFDVAKAENQRDISLKLMSSPFLIADRIYDAITSTHPRQHYVVGAGAGSFRWMKSNLPEYVMTWVTSKTLDREMNPLLPRSKL
jgi:NAD(P)-dependent dehydrogenase (short-subunit alcohol dehydrogenase family)